VVLALRKNTTPLQDLLQHAYRLTQGSFEHPFEVEGPREVRDLGRVFEQIRLRFRHVVSGAITPGHDLGGTAGAVSPSPSCLMMLRFTSQTGVLVVMDGSNLGRICIKDGEVRGAYFKESEGFLPPFMPCFLLPKRVL